MMKVKKSGVANLIVKMPAGQAAKKKPTNNATKMAKWLKRQRTADLF